MTPIAATSRPGHDHCECNNLSASLIRVRIATGISIQQGLQGITVSTEEWQEYSIEEGCQGLVAKIGGTRRPSYGS
jgi:hypothetical protein